MESLTSASSRQRFSRQAESIRRWFRPPRRLRFSRAGGVFTCGTLLLGFAAVGTGNNLLYLVLGAMLGFITLSGWLSEQMIRRVEVRRRPPRGLTAGHPARIAYEVRNDKRRLPSLAVEVGEAALPGRAWVPSVEPGATAVARAEVVFTTRGVFPLETVTLATSFPFGLFRKERDVEIPGEAVVWPRHDLPVREPRPAGERVRRAGESFAGAAGARGEYRGLRPYRAGDDPRDVHWRTTARRGEPVIREYERDRSRALWICLDLRAEPGGLAESAVEIAASLAGAASRRGEPFALATADARVSPGTGAAQLERVLDALARARIRADAPAPNPPVPAGECVLVTARAGGRGRWGDVYAAEREGR
ncbi:DUF58 domain-containing protein [Longimicrobium sp.]|uniref:DUF58 domain-containing protein n=1 Tax=Longimicrobium sp. TaxID=2029185 RepID=UPI002B7CEE16|nr:DUF58 domain-containing protein [Longimicrobium sp.]HSU17811.1 DUF58 domain-containing protein [Longimicrobium sp.]